MKSLTLSFLVPLFFSVTIYCQKTIQTPYGTDIVALVESEMTTAERVILDQSRKDSFPSIILIGTYPDKPQYPDLSSSNRFNCHGYAWYMCDGDWTNHDTDDPTPEALDDPVLLSTADAEDYFTNGDVSYKACSKVEADIWLMDNREHSALATSTTDYLQSKWDNGPLAYHHKDACPYADQSPEYFKRCFKKISRSYTGIENVNYCKATIENSSLDENADVTMEFEDWVRIEGPFSTGSGAKLSISPE